MFMSTKQPENETAASLSESDGSAPQCPPGTVWDPDIGACVGDRGGRGALSDAVASTETESDDKA